MATKKKTAGSNGRFVLVIRERKTRKVLRTIGFDIGDSICRTLSMTPKRKIKFFGSDDIEAVIFGAKSDLLNIGAYEKDGELVYRIDGPRNSSHAYECRIHPHDAVEEWLLCKYCGCKITHTGYEAEAHHRKHTVEWCRFSLARELERLMVVRQEVIMLKSHIWEVMESRKRGEADVVSAANNLVDFFMYKYAEEIIACGAYFAEAKQKAARLLETEVVS